MSFFKTLLLDSPLFRKFWIKDEDRTDKIEDPCNDSKKEAPLSEIRQKTYHPVSSCKTQWKEWSQRTTFHGVHAIFDSNRSLVWRILWFLILGIMWYQLVNGWIIQTERFLQYKTLNQDEIRYDPYLEFPAVTICNFNRVRKERFKDPRDKAILRNLYLELPNATKLEEYPGKDYVLNFSLRNALIEGAMTLNETFISCIRPWKGTVKTCSPIAQFAGDDYCYTVNSKEGNDSIISTWYQEIYDGMYLVLWTNQEQYYLSYAMSAGFKVIIHNADEPPNTAKALVVSPGQMYYMSIDKHEYSFLPSPAKALGEMECVQLSLLPDSYSIQQCLIECRSDYIYNICECVGPSEVDEQGFKRECNPFEIIDCYNSAMSRFFTDGEMERCSCPIPCFTVEYKTTLSSAAFPSTEFASTYWENSSIPDRYLNLSQNAVQLRIFYESKVVSRHLQVLEFSYEDLNASIGGYLGLMIGASAVSLIELLELVALSVFRCCIPRRR